MTNIARLPIVEKDFASTTSTDWTGSWFFRGPGSATSVRDANHARGTMSAITLDRSAVLGTYRLVMTDVSGPAKRFAVSDMDGSVLAQGVVGTPLTAAGMTFTLSAGGGDFVVGDGYSLAVLPFAIDLSGIRFDMALRKSRSTAFGPYRATVDLSASTLGSDPALSNGTTNGVLSFAVPRAQMETLAPGDYDYEVVGTAEGLTVLAARGTLRHDHGIVALSAA